MSSWTEIERVYNKVKLIQEVKGQIMFYEKIILNSPRKNILAQMKMRLTCSRMMGSETIKERSSSWSKTYHIICQTWIGQCYDSGSLVFVDDVMADRSSWSVQSYIQPNAGKLITVEMDNDSECTENQTKSFSR